MRSPRQSRNWTWRAVIPDAPQLSLSWALAEARTFPLQGVGRLARTERAAARQRAEHDTPAYLAAETAQLREIRHQLTDEAEREGWLGEVEGLQVSLAGARDQLAQLDADQTRNR
ncbi:hypothetical protein ABZY05_07315 [Streptomyces canus]|uniref:hypothetical protein n=1 Tax=Streptomyces canus TaxID=58343 RepID=UPI0033A0AD06